MPSRFRGPLLGASGASRGVPAQLIDGYRGFHKTVINQFANNQDIEITNTPVRLVQTLINAGTGASITIDRGLGGTQLRVPHIPGARIRFSDTNNQGSQYVDGPNTGGFGMDSSGLASARTYNPSLKLHFDAIACIVNNNFTNAAFAVGLMSNVAVLTNAGAVATGGGQDGIFFHIPQTGGPVTCVTIANGTVQASTNTGITLTQSVSSPSLAFGIRAEIRQLTNAARPVLTGEVGFYLSWSGHGGGLDHEALIATHSSGVAMPITVRPGICGVKLSSGVSASDILLPYWAMSVGPIF